MGSADQEVSEAAPGLQFGLEFTTVRHRPGRTEQRRRAAAADRVRIDDGEEDDDDGTAGVLVRA